MGADVSDFFYFCEGSFEFFIPDILAFGGCNGASNVAIVGLLADG